MGLRPTLPSCRCTRARPSKHQALRPGAKMARVVMERAVMVRVHDAAALNAMTPQCCTPVQCPRASRHCAHATPPACAVEVLTADALASPWTNTLATTCPRAAAGAVRLGASAAAHAWLLWDHAMRVSSAGATSTAQPASKAALPPSSGSASSTAMASSAAPRSRLGAGMELLATDCKMGSNDG